MFQMTVLNVLMFNCLISNVLNVCEVGRIEIEVSRHESTNFLFTHLRHPVKCPGESGESLPADLAPGYLHSISSMQL